MCVQMYVWMIITIIWRASFWGNFRIWSGRCAPRRPPSAVQWSLRGSASLPQWPAHASARQQTLCHLHPCRILCAMCIKIKSTVGGGAHICMVKRGEFGVVPFQACRISSSSSELWFLFAIWVVLLLELKEEFYKNNKSGTPPRFTSQRCYNRVRAVCAAAVAGKPWSSAMCQTRIDKEQTCGVWKQIDGMQLTTTAAFE